MIIGAMHVCYVTAKNPANLGRISGADLEGGVRGVRPPVLRIRARLHALDADSFL